jgi:hypothetical protein
MPGIMHSQRWVLSVPDAIERTGTRLVMVAAGLSPIPVEEMFGSIERLDGDGSTVLLVKRTVLQRACPGFA